MQHYQLSIVALRTELCVALPSMRAISLLSEFAIPASP
jgi:hypothetical protein